MRVHRPPHLDGRLCRSRRESPVLPFLLVVLAHEVNYGTAYAAANPAADGGADDDTNQAPNSFFLAAALVFCCKTPGARAGLDWEVAYAAGHPGFAAVFCKIIALVWMMRAPVCRACGRKDEHENRGPKVGHRAARLAPKRRSWKSAHT